jgi:hypothetical protein
MTVFHFPFVGRTFGTLKPSFIVASRFVRVPFRDLTLATAIHGIL